MAYFKRIFLFLAVNVLVVVTISFTLSLLGVRPYMHRYGIDYSQLAVFCLVWGMGGAFISLGISRIMAKMAMGVQVIDPANARGDDAWLVQTVHRLARQAGLPEMPEVGVYDSPEVNAFATGPTRSRSLVAVSTGILRAMSPEELEGVLGHEISHVANGDMVTMTLLQGVINAFVMFLARALAFVLTQNSRDERGGGNWSRYMLTMVLEIAFSLLGMLVVAWFSRHREFRADKGGATIAGREKMVGALRRLQQTVEAVDTRQQSLAAFKISNKRGFLALLSTHPPLEDRIRALQSQTL